MSAMSSPRVSPRETPRDRAMSEEVTGKACSDASCLNELEDCDLRERLKQLSHQLVMTRGEMQSIRLSVTQQSGKLEAEVSNRRKLELAMQDLREKKKPESPEAADSVREQFEQMLAKIRGEIERQSASMYSTKAMHGDLLSEQALLRQHLDKLSEEAGSARAEELDGLKDFLMERVSEVKASVDLQGDRVSEMKASLDLQGQDVAMQVQTADARVAAAREVADRREAELQRHCEEADSFRSEIDSQKRCIDALEQRLHAQETCAGNWAEAQKSERSGLSDAVRRLDAMSQEFKDLDAQFTSQVRGLREVREALDNEEHQRIAAVSKIEQQLGVSDCSAPMGTGSSAGTEASTWVPSSPRSPRASFCDAELRERVAQLESSIKSQLEHLRPDSVDAGRQMSVEMQELLAKLDEQTRQRLELKEECKILDSKCEVLRRDLAAETAQRIASAKDFRDGLSPRNAVRKPSAEDLQQSIDLQQSKTKDLQHSIDEVHENNKIVRAELEGATAELTQELLRVSISTQGLKQDFENMKQVTEAELAKLDVAVFSLSSVAEERAAPKAQVGVVAPEPALGAVQDALIDSLSRGLEAVNNQLPQLWSGLQKGVQERNDLEEALKKIAESSKDDLRESSQKHVEEAERIRLNLGGTEDKLLRIVESISSRLTSVEDKFSSPRLGYRQTLVEDKLDMASRMSTPLLDQRISTRLTSAEEKLETVGDELAVMKRQWQEAIVAPVLGESAVRDMIERLVSTRDKTRDEKIRSIEQAVELTCSEVSTKLNSRCEGIVEGLSSQIAAIKESFVSLNSANGAPGSGSPRSTNRRLLSVTEEIASEREDRRSEAHSLRVSVQSMQASLAALMEKTLAPSFRHDREQTEPSPTGAFELKDGVFQIRDEASRAQLRRDVMANLLKQEASEAAVTPGHSATASASGHSATVPSASGHSATAPSASGHSATAPSASGHSATAPSASDRGTPAASSGHRTPIVAWRTTSGNQAAGSERPSSPSGGSVAIPAFQSSASGGSERQSSTQGGSLVIPALQTSSSPATGHRVETITLESSPKATSPSRKIDADIAHRRYQGTRAQYSLNAGTPTPGRTGASGSAPVSHQGPRCAPRLGQAQIQAEGTVSEPGGRLGSNPVPLTSRIVPSASPQQRQRKSIPEAGTRNSSASSVSSVHRAVPQERTPQSAPSGGSMRSPIGISGDNMRHRSTSPWPDQLIIPTTPSIRSRQRS